MTEKYITKRANVYYFYISHHILIPNLPKICRKPWIFATIFAAICLNEFAAANFAAMDLPLAAAMRQIDMYTKNSCHIHHGSK